MDVDVEGLGDRLKRLELRITLPARHRRDLLTGDPARVREVFLAPVELSQPDPEIVGEHVSDRRPLPIGIAHHFRSLRRVIRVAHSQTVSIG